MALAERVATLSGKREEEGERRGENDYENRERRGEVVWMVVVVVRNSERGVFVSVSSNDDEHSYGGTLAD